MEAGGGGGVGTAPSVEREWPGHGSLEGSSGQDLEVRCGCVPEQPCSAGTGCGCREVDKGLSEARFFLNSEGKHG